jgi:ABC-type branched-subunit amino acid transport system ATPase component
MSGKLHLQDVKKSFGGRTVVNIGDIAFGNHGIEGLIGPNGAGKTTLMKLITRRLTADTGKITYIFKGSEINETPRRYSTDYLARMGVVQTNQIIRDFASLTIRDSLLLSLAPANYEKFYKLSADKQLRKETQAEIDSYFEYFHFENTDSHALSAGEKKLLDIIRCLVLKPKFLLMDEPTAGLPEDVTHQVMEMMKKKAADEEMSILIVEHDLDLIWSISEYVHFMAEGEILIQGTPEEIRCHETVVEKYMGGTACSE